MGLLWQTPKSIYLNFYAFSNRDHKHTSQLLFRAMNVPILCGGGFCPSRAEVLFQWPIIFLRELALFRILV